MTSKNEKQSAVIDTSLDSENFNNSLEAVRKCTNQDSINTSWDKNYYATLHLSTDDRNKIPPFVSIMVNDALSPVHAKSNSSSQTDDLMQQGDVVDVSVSFSKDFSKQESSNENSDHSLGNKRSRRDYVDADKWDARPWKKTKRTDSCSSSTSDPPLRPSSGLLSSASDTSFKSISSHYSYKKIRKRRLKSDSNLFRNLLRSRKSFGSSTNLSENNLTGGTPRKDRNHRRVTRTNSWRFIDLCSWIGRKGYQSITGLYSELLCESSQKNIQGPLLDELKQIRKTLEEVDKKQVRLEQENEILRKDLKNMKIWEEMDKNHVRLERENEIFREDMNKMKIKIEELEGKLSQLSQVRVFQGDSLTPPPPPPPPPLPPPPLPPSSGFKLPVRSHTIPRCGSAPPRMHGPRLTITPQDIANVKLRKTKDNPVRTKPMQKEKQPLVTQLMLQTTRAKLGRTRPVAASTPKQQLSELEKCLLQETSVTSLYRRRVVRNTFRSAEELRVRPYPSARSCPQRSPRANSLPRRTPLSPLKLPNSAPAN